MKVNISSPLVVGDDPCPQLVFVQLVLASPQRQPHNVPRQPHNVPRQPPVQLLHPAEPGCGDEGQAGSGRLDSAVSCAEVVAPLIL